MIQNEDWRTRLDAYRTACLEPGSRLGWIRKEAEAAMAPVYLLPADLSEPAQVDDLFARAAALPRSFLICAAIDPSSESNPNRIIPVPMSAAATQSK